MMVRAFRCERFLRLPLHLFHVPPTPRRLQFRDVEVTAGGHSTVIGSGSSSCASGFIGVSASYYSKLGLSMSKSPEMWFR
jgi:hypothetical protein